MYGGTEVRAHVNQLLSGPSSRRPRRAGPRSLARGTPVGGRQGGKEETETRYLSLSSQHGEQERLMYPRYSQNWDRSLHL